MSGVCGKKPDVAAMQDLLVYVTKGISAVTTALRQEGKQVSAEINHLITRINCILHGALIVIVCWLVCFRLLVLIHTKNFVADSF